MTTLQDLQTFLETRSLGIKITTRKKGVTVCLFDFRGGLVITESDTILGGIEKAHKLYLESRLEECAKRLEWASKIPALLSDGPKSPHQLRELLKIAKSRSTFSKALDDCLQAGKITVCETTRGSLYSLTSQ